MESAPPRRLWLVAKDTRLFYQFLANLLHVVSEVWLAVHWGKGLVDLLPWNGFFCFWDGVL